MANSHKYVERQKDTKEYLLILFTSISKPDKIIYAVKNQDRTYAWGGATREISVMQVMFCFMLVASRKSVYFVIIHQVVHL